MNDGRAVAGTPENQSPPTLDQVWELVQSLQDRVKRLEEAQHPPTNDRPAGEAQHDVW